MGGFSSVLIIVIVIIFFQSNIGAFFNKTNITSTIQNQFDDDPSTIIMDDNSFMFAVSIEQSNFNTLPYFNISVSARTYDSLWNGTKIKTYTPVNLIPCTLDRFQNIFQKFGQNITQAFKEQDLATWLCPDYGYSIHVGGRYVSKIFDFVKIDVTQCSNDTANNEILTWKPTCVSQEKLDAQLKSSTQFRVRLFTINTIVNPSKEKDFAEAYLDDQLFFSFVPHKLLRQSDIYLKRYTINTDNSLVPVLQDQILQDLIQMSDFRDMVLLGSEIDTLFTTLYIRRSPFTIKATRQFQKLDGLLSYLGGFINIVVMALGILVAFYNKQQYLIELANKLYDFNAKNEKNYKQQFRNSEIAKKIKTLKIQNQQLPNADYCENKCQNEHEHELNNCETIVFNPKNRFQRQQEEIIAKLGIKSRKDFLVQQIQNILNRGKPIILSIRYLLSKLLLGAYLRNNDCILMDKAIDKINQDLDIYVIIEKLNQIDLIKDLILNKDQQILFNFQPKKLISISDTKELPSRSEIQFNRRNARQSVNKSVDTQQILEIQNQRDINPSLKGYYKVYKAYDRLFSLEQEAHDKINEILSDKLGKELKDIFQVSQFIHFDQSQEDHELQQAIKNKQSQIKRETQNKPITVQSEVQNLFSGERDLDCEYDNQIDNQIAIQIVK